MWSAFQGSACSAKTAWQRLLFSQLSKPLDLVSERSIGTDDSPLLTCSLNFRIFSSVKSTAENLPFLQLPSAMSFFHVQLILPKQRPKNSGHCSRIHGPTDGAGQGCSGCAAGWQEATPQGCSKGFLSCCAEVQIHYTKATGVSIYNMPEYRLFLRQMFKSQLLSTASEPPCKLSSLDFLPPHSPSPKGPESFW